MSHSVLVETFSLSHYTSHKGFTRVRMKAAQASICPPLHLPYADAVVLNRDTYDHFVADGLLHNRDKKSAIFAAERMYSIDSTRPAWTYSWMCDKTAFSPNDLDIPFGRQFNTDVLSTLR